MAEEYKNLPNFTPLPTDPVDSDLIHINRSGKDYKSSIEKILKTADVIDSKSNTSTVKPPSAKSLKDTYDYSTWQNRTDGLLFAFNDIWTIGRVGSNLTVTIPSGKVVDINSALQLSFLTTAASSVNNGGGIVCVINGNSVTFEFYDDISTFVEAADLTKFVIAKNINGVLRSRLSTVNDSIYPEKTIVTDLSWNFDTSIVDADPGTGEFRMNNATPASVTYLYLSKTSQQGINVANVLLDLTAGSEIQLIQKSDVLRYLIGEVVSITDATDYVKVEITITDSGTLFASGSEIMSSIFYEQAESVGDITRAMINPAVGSGALVINYSLKNEAWATLLGGGGVSIAENITLSLTNTDNATTGYVFLNVTGSARTITFSETIKCSDPRFNQVNTLNLGVGVYLLKFYFDGSNIYVEVTPGILQINQTSITSSATPTPTGNYKENELTITALAEAAAFATPSGTPANMNNLFIEIAPRSTAYALSFSSDYNGYFDSLPSTTIANKGMLLGFVYLTSNNKWNLVSIVNQE